MTISEPLNDIFGDAADILAIQCARWVEESPRFQHFVAVYRTKIRKKVRGLRDEEGRGDLLFELATAHYLLQERRFTIEYEKYGVGKQRTPDFVVTYKTNVVFNVEVKRMRAAAAAAAPALPQADIPHADEPRDSNKLINTICAKLGQLLPGTINLLALSADGVLYQEDSIAQTLKLLKQQADHKDEGYFVRRGFASARDFLHDYERLSAVLIRRSWDDDGAPMALWLNKLAQRPLPNDLYAILRR